MSRLTLAVVLACSFTLSAADQLFALNQTGGYGDSGVHVTELQDNGTLTDVSSFVLKGQVPHSTALDKDNGVYYVITFNATDPSFKPQLVGMSLKTGEVVSSVTLPFAGEPGGLGQAMSWANDLGLMAIAGQDAAGDHLVGTLHPTTGAWKQVAKVSSEDGNVNPVSRVYIPGSSSKAGGEFIIQVSVNGVITNIAVNMGSGQVRKASGGAISAMVYNPKDGMVYGLGMVASPPPRGFNRTVVKMVPATLAVSTVAQVADYGIDGGSLSTLDVKTQSLYWIGMKQPYVPNTGMGFYLVKTSILDGTSSASKAQLCSDWMYCPFSLGYFEHA